MPRHAKYPYIDDFVDNEVYVFSTIGQGPVGPKGDVIYPDFADPIDWDEDTDYPEHTIVLYEGASYLSKQEVPHGIEITDERYWQLTNNYNAQVEELHQEVDGYRHDVEQLSGSIDEISESLAGKAFVFDTVEDMKACSDLFVGAICHTNGYHVLNDGGDAWYKITDNGTANEMDVISCGDLYANLVTDKNNVCINQLGAYSDGTVDCTAIVNYALNNYHAVCGHGRLLIKGTVNLYNEKILIFDGYVISNTASPTFHIDGYRNYLYVYYYYNETADAVFCTIGGSSVCQFNHVVACNCYVTRGTNFILGGNEGVLDSIIEGSRLAYYNNAILFDLSNAYVGQIVVNDFRFTSLNENAWAIDCDCQHNGMTGLIMNNISMEGSYKGIHAYNTTEAKRFETLQVSNVRLAEFANSGRTFLKVEGSGAVYGNIFADWLRETTLDFTNNNIRDFFEKSLYATAGSIYLPDRTFANAIYNKKGGFYYVMNQNRWDVDNDITIYDYVPTKTIRVVQGHSLTIDFTKKNAPLESFVVAVYDTGSFTIRNNGVERVTLAPNTGDGWHAYLFTIGTHSTEMQVWYSEIGSMGVAKVLDY